MWGAYRKALAKQDGDPLACDVAYHKFYRACDLFAANNEGSDYELQPENYDCPPLLRLYDRTRYSAMSHETWVKIMTARGWKP